MKAQLAMLLAGACLVGCGVGSSMSESGPAPTPAQPTGINFTSFTEKLLQIQSDSAQPVPVTTAQFEFPDNDNPQAFAAVLPGA
jgi:hypothetical protein